MHTETTTRDPVPVPFLDNLFGPITMTPYALNFQGEPLHPTFLSVAYASADESCQRKREHLSSSPASS